MRLFIAIPLPDDVAEVLKNLRKPVEGIAWQASRQHITLCFLGETPQRDNATLKKRLATIYHPAFSITVEGMGCFFKGDSPKLIWAGIKKNDALEQLHAAIVKVVKGMGFSVSSQPFKPHITLGRVRDTSQSKKIISFINSRKEWGAIFTFIDCFVLYASKLSKEGALHIPLKRYPLTY